MKFNRKLHLGNVMVPLGVFLILWILLTVLTFDDGRSSGDGDSNQNKHLKDTLGVPDAGKLGYGGRGVHIDKSQLNKEELAEYHIGYRRHNFNEMASNRIPVKRRILNVTENQCLEVSYDLDSLPTVGIVIIFHNEAWSVLLRSLHSVLQTTPILLLKEVILVDDASTHEILHRPLDDYLDGMEKVKLLRLGERSGLMAARMEGLKYVTGEVVVFLDSHVEMAERWLEPLLSRIQQNDRILAVPGIDRINNHDFSYQPVPASERNIGGFDLDLYYNWIPRRPDTNEQPLSPIRSPTHLGCCFAISVKTFKRLGQYDDGLKIWGCENMELSFKVWMCGGHIEIVPCSHVGHMFRNTAPYDYGKGGYDVIRKNCLRIAEVWMDDYKYFYFERIFNQQLNTGIGDVSSRKLLRQQLGCKSFQWYVNNVYPELYLPFDWSASGQVENIKYKGLCIETPIHWDHQGRRVYVEQCDKQILIQHFTLTREKQIRRDEGCLDLDDDWKLVVLPCNKIQSKGWVYRKDRSLINISTRKCLTLKQDGGHHLELTRCRRANQGQKWKWSRGVPDKIKQLRNKHIRNL